MAKNNAVRKKLLERWSVIEQEEDDGLSSAHPTKRRRFCQLKEQWFSDAFNFLIYLPKEDHVWCSYWDLMRPLVETFLNYFKDECNDSPLKLLWNRISGEMRSCVLCIQQHHQAQELYEIEYEKSCIGPLLDVLHTLDEERISLHLKDLNVRIARGEYDMSCDFGEVVGVTFEVLMYPILLDDQYLATEFQNFIQAIDNSHELTLDGQQQYPGVYALLFSNSRRVRSIGLRLSGHMGKLRRSTDIDALQHLLKKCIYILETEGVSGSTETSRPRMQLDRISVWLGMKALVGFLEPIAFEEGILDRYPIFLSIVLNHISDDSDEFSHAVNCLRLLFEKLGCKLWLRATLSPSVMRNTLLGQCFHTRNEKSHKEIFDLFQPFLQSLEALQDGEHEKQRRHFLYFLLHQVPASSNFSILMRKKACQIALLIILRGYRMDPPCPPYECAHMWGPSLVSSLKDSSLHSFLRQPAIDLIQIIIVSDASALISVILNGHLHSIDKPIWPANYGDEEEEEEFLSGFHVEEKEKDISCWEEFSLQHKIISQVNGSWMCIPLLWFDVLVELDPLALPLSFSKAVIWALSLFSLIETENSTEMSLSVRNWLATCASEICYLLMWKVPTGSDDGGDGSESRNSVRTSTMCWPLVRTFKRLTTHYTVKMEQGKLTKQWIWEPAMSNCLILLLVDPNDSTRHVGRLILEQVSNTRGLTCGMQFLCSRPSSLLAILMALRHALKLVHLDSVLLNFQTLHHLFFVLCKLLKEGNAFTQTTAQNLQDVIDNSKLSLQGGFLKQSAFNLSPSYGDWHSSVVSSALWKKFSCLLSQAAWPLILKCLNGGKTFIDYTVSQMTCIRLLEVIPVVFERLPQYSGVMLETYIDKYWLHDLADWGKSSLAVVVRYWKQTMSYLLGQIKASCSNKSASAILDIEKLISCEKVSVDEMSNQIARLYVSLTDEGSVLNKTVNQSKCSPSGKSLNRICGSKESEVLVADEAKRNIIDSKLLDDLHESHVIILSDDEKESDVSAQVGLSNSWSNISMCSDNYHAINAAGGEFETDLKEKDLNTHGGSMVPSEVCPQLVSNSTDHIEKLNLDNDGDIQRSVSPVQAGPQESKQKKIKTRDGAADCFLMKTNSCLMNKSDETVNSNPVHSISSQLSSSDKAMSNSTMNPASKFPQSMNKTLNTTEEAVKETCYADSDTWKFSFFKPPRYQHTLTAKTSISFPKRQIIQLSLPPESSAGSVRLVGGIKRFQPPRLDDWYRSILDLDFFVVIGLASETEDYQTVGRLKEIPVCFQSSDDYVDIFRPLVLEEFKAQLQSSYLEMTSYDETCCRSLSVLSVERIDDFHIIRFVQDENEHTGSKNLLENDLILLTRRPLQHSISDVHAVGKVERREKDNKRRLNILAIRLYLQGCSRLNRARKLLTERSKWYVSRIMSVTPQLREFQALSSIREIPLLPIILNPINHHCGQNVSETENLDKLSRPLQQIFKSSYNSSQLQAINLAIGPVDLKNDFKLTLIQGPPGTGKTRTILAIVSGLLAFSEMKVSKGLRNGGPVHNSSITNRKINQSAAIARAWQDAALARQLNEDVENNYKFAGSCSRGRILICAQSNAAVDELVSRISSEGLSGCDGQRYKPYLVRVGNAKTVHPNSLPFFIDTLVENRLEEEKKKSAHDEKKSESCADSLTMIRANLEKLVDQIRYYEAKCASLQEGNCESKNQVEGDCGDGNALSDTELKVKLRKLYEKKKKIYADLASVQSTERKASEEIRALRHKFRKSILKEAEIVVTTLSGCGGDLYGVCSGSTSSHKFIVASENTLFDAVVIDEAAQALEPATLIPLQLLKSGGTRCIMVGDPKQLPATVLSNVASKYLFQCSMFERLQRAGHPVIMLTQQYRMHPEICHFPSLHFYEGKLLNGDQMSSRAASFHETQCLGPYVFFDITDGQEIRGKNSASLSLFNESEADAAIEVLQFFKKRYPSKFLGRKIGIITPYKHQLSLLRSRFSSAFGSAITSEMEFNTVDGFQGREVDILLLSTVRASGSCTETPWVSSSNIGFVADVRRMNVALTRAKLSLWIFGNTRSLSTNQSWAALVEDAKQRNLIVPGRKPYSSLCKFTLGSSAKSSLNVHSEKVELVNAAGQHLNTRKSAKLVSERKRKCNEAALDIVCTGEEASHSAKGAGIDHKARARDGTKISAVNEAAIPKSPNKVFSGAMSKLEENNKNTDCRDNDRLNWSVKADVGKGICDENMKNHSIDSGKMKRKKQKHPRPVVDEMDLKTINHDKPLEVKTGASSDKRFKEKGEREASNKVVVCDTITKRKQQREAVDALLSSALISSKKSDSLGKSSSKRTLPAKNTSADPFRPPKRRKDT